MTDIIRLDNIIEAIKHLEPNHILGTCLEKEGVAVKHPRYEYMAMPDESIGAFSFSGNFMWYRGENNCFSSCKSSLYRIKERDNKIVALLKTYDFMLFLETLPEVRKYVADKGYYRPWALAQHYEFATPLIDLTNELAVAAFFATHYYDRVCKQYMVMSDGVGRIRRTFSIMDPMLEGALRPIGMQPFVRPERQDGFEYWIPENEDFAERSYAVEFYQDYEINMRLKTAMMGGADYYFPNERISQMAAVIKNTNAVTSMAIIRMLEEVAEGNSYILPVVTADEIDRIRKDRGIFVVDAPVICPEAIPPQVNALWIENHLLVLPAYRKGG